MPANHLLELFLGEDDNLQQFVFVGFVVEKLTQQFQAEGRNLLTLVDYENRGLLLIDPLAEKVLLDEFLDLPIGSVVGRLLAAQQFGNR